MPVRHRPARGRVRSRDVAVPMTYAKAGFRAGNVLDKRHRNNQSLFQRQASVRNRRKKAPGKALETLLAKARVVLQRTGKEVFGAHIDAPMYRGLVMIDGRKMSPEAIIEMAELQLMRENLRNNELRKQHGLAPVALKTLKEI